MIEDKMMMMMMKTHRSLCYTLLRFTIYLLAYLSVPKSSLKKRT